MTPARHESLRAVMARVGDQYSLRYQHQSDCNALRAPIREKNKPRYGRVLDGSDSSYPATLQKCFQPAGEGPMGQDTLTEGT